MGYSNCNPCDPCGTNQNAAKAAAYARQANTYATNAENSWLEFNALYLGAFAVAPTVDNEGEPLQVGALYWNTGSNTMFAWDGTVWVENGNFNEFTNFPITYTTPIPAVDLKTGLEYEIVALGTTNWTAIGAASNTVGVRFTKNAVVATGTGTARVTRDLNTRFADVVNVKDFGAVGDGVADDTAAIRAAIDYANKGQIIGNLYRPVYFPKGTYSISSILLQNRNNLSLIGEGPGQDSVRSCVLFRARDTVDNFFEIRSCEYIKISGISFDSNQKVLKSIFKMIAGGTKDPALGNNKIEILDCAFNVGDAHTILPEVPVFISSCSQLLFTKCFFKGGLDSSGTSKSIHIGEVNPVNPNTGNPILGDGRVQQTIFNNCFFQGNVYRKYDTYCSWINCTFYGKPHESNKMSGFDCDETSPDTHTESERIENCLCDGYVTTSFGGNWYKNTSPGGLILKNNLIQGGATLIRIYGGPCDINGNRPILRSNLAGQSFVKLEENAGYAKIWGNYTYQIREINDNPLLVNGSLVIDERTTVYPPDYYYYYKQKLSDISITNVDQTILSTTYISNGTWLKLKASFKIKLTDSVKRTFILKFLYDGSIAADNVEVTLDELNDQQMVDIERDIYVPHSSTAKTIGVNLYSLSGSGQTGLLMRDSSHWSIKEIYS